MELNERIKSRRLELGLTLEDVGQRIGVTRATVQRYESGEIEHIKLSTIEQLASALDTTPAYLMGWESPKEDEMDVEIRAIARGVKNLSAKDRVLFKGLLETMSRKAHEEHEK